MPNGNGNGNGEGAALELEWEPQQDGSFMLLVPVGDSETAQQIVGAFADMDWDKENVKEENGDVVFMADDEDEAAELESDLLDFIAGATEEELEAELDDIEEAIDKAALPFG